MESDELTDKVERDSQMQERRTAVRREGIGGWARGLSKEKKERLTDTDSSVAIT